MRSRLLRVMAVLVGLVLVAGAAAVVWLGPSDVSWTATAWRAERGLGAPWAWIPADAPLALSCDVPALLGSPAGLAARPRLEEVAAAAGGRLGNIERWVNRAAVTEGLAVGTGVPAAPGLLARFAPRWSQLAAPADAGSTAWVTDGRSALVPLQPGTVLWCEHAGDADAARQAVIAARNDGGQPLLELAPGGPSLRLLVRPTNALRREAARQLPAQASFLAFETDVVRLDVVAGSRFHLDGRIDMRTEASATRLEALLRQADAAARLVRAAGPLAALLGGSDIELLLGLPPLTVSRQSRTVLVEADLTDADVERWLVQARDAVAAAQARSSDMRKSGAKP